MNDTTRRFLTAIVERVPAGGEIVELRLFPAIRQGGIESGVAVVAVRPPEPVPVPDESAQVAPDESAQVAPDESAQVAPDESAQVASDESGGSVIGEGAAGGAADGAFPDASAEPLVDLATDAVSVSDEAFVTAAAHDLVDTDVAVEDEEGSALDDAQAPSSFVPMADTVEDVDVADALDDEVQTIVLNVEREYVPAEAITPEDGAASIGATDDRAAGVTVHVEPGLADDESPYADVPLPQGIGTRPVLADAGTRDVDAEEALAAAIADGRAHFASPVGGIAVIAGPADAAPPEDEESITLGDILALPSPGAVESADGPGAADAPEGTPEAPPPIRRFAILTARYRLVLKGPDRGKWDVEITHEADAPLDTVERVARGVAKRAGEEQDPEHFTGDSLHAALAAPAWVTAP